MGDYSLNHPFPEILQYNIKDPPESNESTYLGHKKRVLYLGARLMAALSEIELKHFHGDGNQRTAMV